MIIGFLFFGTKIVWTYPSWTIKTIIASTDTCDLAFIFWRQKEGPKVQKRDQNGQNRDHFSKKVPLRDQKPKEGPTCHHCN